MKFVAFTFLVILSFASTAASSSYNTRYCIPKWKARSNCPTAYYRDGCKYKVTRTVRKRVCRRRCRKCKKRCYRKMVKRTYKRRGYVCGAVSGGPNPGFPLPAISFAPVSRCPESCVRWWRRATRGCNPSLCKISPCPYGRRGGWKCTLIAPAAATPTPTAITAITGTPTSSPSPIGAASCFGGCRQLASARLGCNALFCKNVPCRRVGTELYYSCVPNFIPTVSPSASATPTSSPGSSPSSSPISTPFSSPIICPRTCQTTGDAFTKFTAANTNCQRPQCAVVPCSLSTTAGTTGFGCVFARELTPGQIDLTSFLLTGISPSPSPSASPVSTTPTVYPVSPTPSSVSISRHVTVDDDVSMKGAFAGYFV